jgi:uncharacterized Fe-S center protein
MASKVHFVRVPDGEGDVHLAEKGARLYAEAGFGAMFQADRLVGIKQHFGERGGDGYLKPPITRRFVELVKESGAKPFLTDTSTLYAGNRGNAVNYLNICHEHGFTHEQVGCPVIMADGLVGASQVMVEVNGKHYKRVPIASDAFHAFGFVVLTHVTGHPGAGFGASLKNVAMGMASRAGKLDQHHGDVPLIDTGKCTACAKCAGLCPAHAITVDDVAVIDKTKCIGCGECLAVCPFGAVGFRWAETSVRLSEKMAEHALAVKKTHEGRMCYFNYATHITKGCDCFGVEQPVECADVGILASDDMIAVDKATMDVMASTLGKDLFREFYPDIGSAYQLEYGASLGLGSLEYDLVEIG